MPQPHSSITTMSVCSKTPPGTKWISSPAKISCILFITFAVLLNFCHQRGFKSATPVSRLDLLHSVVERNSLTIDAFERNTTDKALYAGHYYCDKAPGTA